MSLVERTSHTYDDDGASTLQKQKTAALPRAATATTVSPTSFLPWRSIEGKAHSMNLKQLLSGKRVPEEFSCFQLFCKKICCFAK